MAVTADVLHAKRNGGTAKRMLKESWRWDKWAGREVVWGLRDSCGRICICVL